MLTPFHGSVGGRDLPNVHVCTFGLEAIEYLQPSRPIFFPKEHEREESTDRQDIQQTNKQTGFDLGHRHNAIHCSRAPSTSNALAFADCASLGYIYPPELCYDAYSGSFDGL